MPIRTTTAGVRSKRTTVESGSLVSLDLYQADDAMIRNSITDGRDFSLQKRQKWTIGLRRARE